jgi:hypothetical protein
MASGLGPERLSREAWTAARWAAYGVRGGFPLIEKLFVGQ